MTAGLILRRLERTKPHCCPHYSGGLQSFVLSREPRVGLPVHALRLWRQGSVETLLASSPFPDLEGADRGSGEGWLVLGLILEPVTEAATKMGAAVENAVPVAARQA